MVRKRTIAGLAGFAGLMALIPWSAQADQVFLDDVIVDGSLCVGVDCVNGESFGFDTIRLKENNLRIDFTDTSVSASFPTTDWELQANESSNGGKNWFAFLDTTASRRIFTMEGGAPTNAMYIDSAGDVGLGTNTPVVEFEIVDGDSPTVRLRQDGSSGFTPQTWDMVGNETNFFVRDVTNGSQLPFRIEPGADTNSLYIENDNDVGIGTNNPSANLDIRDGDSRVAVEMDANGDLWQFIVDEDGDANEGFSFTRGGTGTREFRVTPDGEMILSNGAGTFASFEIVGNDICVTPPVGARTSLTTGAAC